jgi:putative redox protein
MAIAVIGKEHYKTEVTTSGHSVFVDEPVDVGGTDTAPAPSEFLEVALASCTAITIRMYADRKGWAVKKISVDVSISKDDKLTRFDRKILLQGELSEEQRARLLQIANSCPVHKVLSNPIEVNTSLIDLHLEK